METVFTGVRAVWRPLYDQILNMAQNALGPFEEKATGSAMLWRHDTTFAEVRAKKEGLVVGFASDRVHDEWSPVKVEQTSKRRAVHYFDVADSAAFAPLIDRLSEAYALTKPAAPRKRPPEPPPVETIDAYIDWFPQEVQPILKAVRQTIRQAAPEATERMSWRMPTFYLHENLVHFAGFAKHLGFYPAPSAIEAFADRLAPYRRSKGAVQFPYDRPIPYDLIADMTRFRVREVNAQHSKEGEV